MSQALFERAADGRHEARRRARRRAERVHPEVVEVMRELGIDLVGSHAAAARHGRLAEWADVVVTMGCGDDCPYIPGKRYVDWDLPDPKGCRSTRSAPSATRSAGASVRWSPSSTASARVNRAPFATRTR